MAPGTVHAQTVRLGSMPKSQARVVAACVRKEGQHLKRVSVPVVSATLASPALALDRLRAGHACGGSTLGSEEHRSVSSVPAAQRQMSPECQHVYFAAKENLQIRQELQRAKSAPLDASHQIRAALLASHALLGVTPIRSTTAQISEQSASRATSGRIPTAIAPLA
jgi:hypothetical protein